MKTESFEVFTVTDSKTEHQAFINGSDFGTLLKNVQCFQ